MAAKTQKRRLMPIVLGLSLAVNLGVLAALAGAAWRHHGDAPRGDRVARGGAIYMQALPREARRALREELREARPARREGSDMLVALRQDPFDPAAVRSVLEAERQAGLSRQEAATSAWISHITDMTGAERRAYADRLQALLEKRGSGKRPD